MRTLNKLHTLRASLTLPLARSEVFEFFASPENLERLTPRELRFRIDRRPPGALQPGDVIEYSLSLHGIPFRWRTLISRWAPPLGFADEQLRGPFAEWIHRHTFTEVAGGTRIDDEVRYRLPLGPVGNLAHPLVHRQLTAIFAYRQRAVADALVGACAPVVLQEVVGA